MPETDSPARAAADDAPTPILSIGNRNSSSWSMRAWLVLAQSHAPGESDGDAHPPARVRLAAFKAEGRIDLFAAETTGGAFAYVRSYDTTAGTRTQPGVQEPDQEQETAMADILIAAD